MHNCMNNNVWLKQKKNLKKSQFWLISSQGEWWGLPFVVTFAHKMQTTPDGSNLDDALWWKCNKKSLHFLVFLLLNRRQLNCHGDSVWINEPLWRQNNPRAHEQAPCSATPCRCDLLLRTHSYHNDLKNIYFSPYNRIVTH